MEAEKNEINVGVFIIFNPAQTGNVKDAEAMIRKTMTHQEASIKVTFVPSKEQKKDTYEIQIAGVK